MLAQPMTLYGAVTIVPTTIKNHVVKSIITCLISLDENNNIGLVYTQELMVSKKGALSWYGKLTWESAHAWNLIILCLLIVWGMTFIFMVHLSVYAIPLLIYDVMYYINTIP